SLKSSANVPSNSLGCIAVVELIMRSSGVGIQPQRSWLVPSYDRWVQPNKVLSECGAGPVVSEQDDGRLQYAGHCNCHASEQMNGWVHCNNCPSCSHITSIRCRMPRTRYFSTGSITLICNMRVLSCC